MKAFEKNIRKVQPYVPGEQPRRPVVKLNTNENPYPPAPGVKKALRSWTQTGSGSIRTRTAGSWCAIWRTGTAWGRIRCSWGLALTMCCPCAF